MNYASHAQEIIGAAMDTDSGQRVSWRDTPERDNEVFKAAANVQTRKLGMYPSTAAPGHTSPLDSGTRRHGMSPLAYIGKMQRDLREMRARRIGVKVAR